VRRLRNAAQTRRSSRRSCMSKKRLKLSNATALRTGDQFPVNRTARGLLTRGEHLNTPSGPDEVFRCAERFSRAGVSGNELVRRVAASTERSTDFVRPHLKKFGF
jgi:hypothetical protein